jgi:hypothetical protein
LAPLLSKSRADILPMISFRVYPSQFQQGFIDFDDCAIFIGSLVSTRSIVEYNPLRGAFPPGAAFRFETFQFRPWKYCIPHRYMMVIKEWKLERNKMPKLTFLRSDFLNFHLLLLPDDFQV